jgi:hypothetical protein
MNENLLGKRSTRRKHAPHTFTWHDLGWNPGLRGGKHGSCGIATEYLHESFTDQCFSTVGPWSYTEPWHLLGLGTRLIEMEDLPGRRLTNI